MPTDGHDPFDDRVDAMEFAAQIFKPEALIPNVDRP